MAAIALLLAAGVAAINVGDKIPSGITLDYGFPPDKINLASRIAGKKVPGYLEHADALKEIGIDEVIIFCVNDGAVMDAWGKDQGVERSSGFISMMGDPTGSLTAALGVELLHPGPIGLGLLNRCKRFAAYIVDGTVKLFTIAERPDDPAGDDFPESTLAPAIIAAVKALGKEEL